MRLDRFTGASARAQRALSAGRKLREHAELAKPLPHAGDQLAPRPVKTTGMVFKMSWKS